jgi:hypothetical protein
VTGSGFPTKTFGNDAVGRSFGNDASKNDKQQRQRKIRGEREITKITKIIASYKIPRGFNVVNNPVLPQAMRGTRKTNAKSN